MKISTLIAALTTVMSLNVFAASEPLHLMEKASHRLMNMIKKNEAPAYISTDMNRATARVVQMPDGQTATQITMYASSTNPQDPNWVSVYYDSEAKVLATDKHIVSAAENSPIFTQTEGARLLDLGTEIVLDNMGPAHPELQLIAETTESVDMVKKEQSVLFLIHLTDRRTYQVVTDLDGNLISQGF